MPLMLSEDFDAAFEAEVKTALAYSPTAENVRDHLLAWVAKHVMIDIEVDASDPDRMVIDLVIDYARAED